MAKHGQTDVDKKNNTFMAEIAEIHFLELSSPTFTFTWRSGGQVPKSELTKTPRDEEDDEPLFPLELSSFLSSPRLWGIENAIGAHQLMS